MYPSSSAYKTAIAAAARTTRITGVLTLAGGSTVNLTNADIVQGTLTMSEQCVSGDALEIGNVYASELNVGLVTPASSPWSLSGAKLALSFGIDVSGVPTWEDSPLGVFWVTEIERKANYSAVKALDSMILLDVPLGTTNVTAKTPEQLIVNACATAGVTLATTHTAFETYPNKAMVLTLPANSSVVTCRDLIMWACQVNATFARMNRAGQLEVLPLHSASVRTITATERYAPTNVSDFTVQVTGVQEQVLDVLHSTGTAVNSMMLDGNPLLESQTSAAIDTALAAILADITQAVYTPFDIDFIGDPSLQAGDYVTLSGTGSLGANPVGLVTHSFWRYRESHSLTSAGMPGIVKTVVDQNGKRITSLSANLITADRVVTGKLSSADGGTYFDLDTPEIVQTATVGGKAVKVTMSPTKPYELAIDGKPQIYISSAGVLVTSIYDINEDGLVDDIDYNLIKTYLLYSTGYLPRMDVNGDGNVTLTDLVLVKRASLGSGTLQETGTFTPTLAGATTAGTWTYTHQVGNYVKIGCLVWFSITLRPATIGGSPAGNLQIKGLPFSADAIRTVFPIMTDNVAWGTSMTQIQAYMVSTGGTDLLVYGQLNNGTMVAVPVGNVAVNDSIYLSGCYQTSA
jgi:hypothetical protein